MCHLDIKPQNIFIDSHGIIKIGDFGVTKLKKDFEMWLGKQTEGHVGTLSYMAPELWLKIGSSVKSDIFSLGVTLYFVYMLVPPF